MAGDRNHAAPQESSFWAYLSTAGGLNGLFWSWVRVVPVESPPTADDPWTVQDVPLWDFAEPLVSGYQTAREANGNRQAPTGTVALLAFAGSDRAGEGLYVFTYNPAAQQTTLLIHDHRDNLAGGFCFATYHPGTGLPQQPWGA